MRHPTIYIAAPLFSDAERAFNIRVRDVLTPHFSVFLPQESGQLLRKMLSCGEALETSMRRIFDSDVAAIRDADYFLLVLDGRAVDEGAAFELGIAFCAGKKCIGLQTDWRQLLPVGQNPMIAVPLDRIFFSIEELQTWARTQRPISLRRQGSG